MVRSNKKKKKKQKETERRYEREREREKKRHFTSFKVHSADNQALLWGHHPGTGSESGSPFSSIKAPQKASLSVHAEVTREEDVRCRCDIKTST